MLSRFLKTTLLHLSYYLVIPLMGWVLGGPTPIFSQLGRDLSAFFQHPARLAFAVLAVAAAAVRGSIAARIPLPPHAFSLLSDLQRWRNIALESILVLAPFCDQRGLLVWGEIAALRWLGAALFGGGIALVLAATRIYLLHEKTRQPAPAPRLLLMSGPYQKVRHPVQLGMLILALGVAVLFRSWIGLILLVFMLNTVLMQIRNLEKLMPQQYGLQWAAYIKKSWRLIPHLY